MAVETRSNTLAVPAESGRNRITLEPLRDQGADAIRASGITGLLRVALTEVHLTWDNVLAPMLIWVALDVLDPAAFEIPLFTLIPTGAIITKAAFNFYFSDAPTIPRLVTLSPPFNIELARPSDEETIRRWATSNGFIEPIESRSGSDEQTMAIAS
jgi:hypothetical protein